MSIILANFGKYAISDCPFIVMLRAVDLMMQCIRLQLLALLNAIETIQLLPV